MKKPYFLTNFIIATSALGLAACLPVKKEIQIASRNGDFSLLGCGDLAAAEGSLRQRLASPTLGNAKFGATDSRGKPVTERRDLLEQAAQSLSNLRVERDCISSAPIVTATESFNAPVGTASSLEAQTGRYLQVATYRDPANRDDMVARLEAAGLQVRTVNGVLADTEYSRILVGPLTDRNEIVRATETARSLGLNDAFYVDG